MPDSAALREKIRKLSEVLASDPANQPARMELIQAYTDAGRVDDFLREAAAYKQIERRKANTNSTPIPPREPEESGRPKTTQADGSVSVEPIRGYFDAPSTPPEPRKRFATGTEAQAPLEALAREYAKVRTDAGYLAGLDRMLARLAYRPTPMFHARRLSAHLGGARLYLKNDVTGRTDPHLAIAVAGQVHLARALGRSKLVAGVRNVHWGVRAAAACAHIGLAAEIYIDEATQESNGALVFQMQLMGARVVPVRLSRLPNADIREAALEAWLASPRDSFLFMGLDSGPEPYTQIGRDLTAAIGREMQREIVADAGRGPDAVVCRGGDNADALAVMPAFLDDPAVRLYCVEARPLDPPKDNNKVNPFYVADTGMDAARVQAILEGLEYESVARERSLLKASGRIEFIHVDFEGARDALRNLARLEGMTMGLQTAHAAAHACALARSLPPDGIVALLLAERSDKDLWDIAKLENLGV